MYVYMNISTTRFMYKWMTIWIFGRMNTLIYGYMNVYIHDRMINSIYEFTNI